MSDIRTLFAPLTKPVGTWIKRAWWMSRLDVFGSDVDVMNQINESNRKAIRYRQQQMADIQSKLNRL